MVVCPHEGCELFEEKSQIFVRYREQLCYAARRNGTLEGNEEKWLGTLSCQKQTSTGTMQPMACDIGAYIDAYIRFKFELITVLAKW